MLYLTACALNSITPERAVIKKMDPEKLYEMSKFHSLTAAVCTALESAGVVLPKKWKEENAKAVRKNILLDAERANILNFMEQSGIWYMPLKGVVLKELYPKMGMRQMSDNDILFDEKYVHDVTEYMVSKGYTPEYHKHSNHCSYTKPPIYNYEMHMMLFAKSSPMYGYYSKIKNKLIKDTDNQYGYHFSDEDFYVYLISHEFKHYNGGGTGLRSLADCYIYNKKKNQLDRKYIAAELKKLGLYDFEQRTRILADKVFAVPSTSPVLTNSEREMLEDHLISGTYGTIKNKVKKNIKKYNIDTKQKYLLKKLLPDMEHYRKYFPFFYRHKILLPVAWIFRLVRAFVLKRKNIIAEIKALNSINQVKP